MHRRSRRSWHCRGYTQVYRLPKCQHLWIYGESSEIPPLANGMEKPISNLGREIGYLESDSRDYRQSKHMESTPPPHTGPQFRHYIWRKHWHGLNVFSTKTRRSMLPADVHRPSLLIREKFRFVTRKIPLESRPRDNLKGFHSFRQSRQYQTTVSNSLLPHSAHSNTSCLGLGRLQSIHEPWQFKGPVVTHLESSGRSEQYHPGNYP
jgi:hypothetical protein